MKIGAYWSIIFGLIALILGALLGFEYYTDAVTSGWIFLVLGIISLIIGGYDVYQK